METNKNESQKLKDNLRKSPIIKLLIIGLIIMLLMIPRVIINGLIFERKHLQQEATADINSKWGNDQEIAGLILSVPYYKESKRDSLGNIISSSTEYIHFTPETLSVEGQVNTEIRYRSIYESILYQSQLSCKGTFEKPSEKIFGVPDKDILWDQCHVSLGVSDLKGLKDNVKLKWNGKQYLFKPSRSGYLPSHNVLAVPVNILSGKQHFSFQLNLNGSQTLSFVPLAKTTNVSIQSDWENPSFYGDLLPDKREINDSGFVSSWKILEVNRNIPEYWNDQKVRWSGTQFGVKFFNPVDHYKKTERSIKYSLLTIALTFMVYFLFEFINKKKIHIIRYFLVGISLVFFYSLLLSLSEHLGFNAAYLVSAAAITSSILIYSHPVLRSAKITTVLGIVVGGLFTFVFALLQLEEYALLVGNIGLFFILLSVMLISRKWNWSNMYQQE